MKGNAKGKRKLIGSISIVSTVALVSVAFGPSVLFNVPQEKKVVDTVTLRDFWDIIVPDDFDNIQEAVDNAVTGDRIFVRNGVYKSTGSFFSGALSIKTPGLTIHGQHTNDTIIDGRGVNNVVSIIADETNISGFTITNNGVNGTLIGVTSSNNIIKDNVLDVVDFYDGIEYGMKFSNAYENTISGNVVSGAERGIYLKTSDYNIFDNNVIRNNDIGLNIDEIFMIDFDLRIAERDNFRSCSGNSLIGNTIEHNGMGIFLDHSPDNIIFNNVFISNRKNGLIFSSCINNQVKNNTFVDDGFDIWGSELDHFIHDVKNNIVNDKPLYYYYDKHGFTVLSDAGQVILVYCNDVNVKNVDICNTSIAVLAVYCSDIYVTDSNIENCSRGVFFYYTVLIHVNRNNFIDNDNPASFISKGFFSSKTMNWNRNYWGSRIFKRVPKKIVGRIHLNRNFRLFPNLKLGIKVKRYDKIPARNPF